MQQELQKHYCGYKAWNKRQDQTWKLWYNRYTLLQSGVKWSFPPQYSKNRKKAKAVLNTGKRQSITQFKSSVKYRKGDFTQFLDPVIQFSCFNGENKCLFSCLHQKRPTIPWTAFNISLRNTNAVIHFYHLL